MNTKFKSTLIWTMYMILALSALFIMDGFVQPGYWIKSFIKLIIFGLIPIIGLIIEKRLPNHLFELDQNLSKILAFCLGLIVLIILGYFMLLNFTTFTNIPQALNEQVGVTFDNFLWVSLYIIVINSFLEEFFFRYLFLNVLATQNKHVSMGLSAFCFSLYHVGILFGWFDLWLFLLMVFGLFLVGIFFIKLNTKAGSIANSYLVHLSANIGINIVGFILLSLNR